MVMKYADMHIHTCCSDGFKSPKQIVLQALQQKIDLIAITDHNTVEGIGQAQEAAVGTNLIIVPAIELSIAFKTEMHLLGYFIDIRDSRIQKYIVQKKKDEFVEAIQLLRKVKKYYKNIAIEDFLHEERINARSVAEVLIKRLPNINKNEVAELLSTSGLLHVTQRELSPEEGIKLILNAGGIPVLAHPGRMKLSTEKLCQVIDVLKGFGLMGMECIHYSHTPEEEANFIDICRKCRLKVSSGSDYHGNQVGRFVLPHPKQLDIEQSVLSYMLKSSYGIRFLE